MNSVGLGQVGRVSTQAVFPNSVNQDGLLQAGGESRELVNLNNVKIGDMIKKVNEMLEKESSHVEYEFHEVFKDIIIKVVDDKTNNVLVEVPPRKILDFVARLCELSGILVDKKI